MRDSQESKVTSTPQSTSLAAFSLSPSISSITNEAAMEIDSGSEYRESGDTDSTLDDIASIQSGADDSRTRLTDIRHIKWVAFWSSLKPKNKNSLYYKIMTQPKELESIVSDLFKVYHKNEESAVVMLLQLFVDLCGYKKLQVEKFYKFNRLNAKELIEKMECELMEPELKKSGKFLFMRCSKFEMNIDNILSQFLKYLVIQGFRNDVIFDEVFVGHVFEFLNCMSFSSIRCIRVTGIILVVNLITALVNLYSEFLTLVQDENSNTPEEVNVKKASIESFMDFLYLIYNKNCLISDKKCYPVKVKCAQEMYHWIQLFPEIFIHKRRCLGRLLKLVLDHNELVRLSALGTCEKLINNEEIETALSKRGEVFFKTVSTRILDVSHKVAVRAVTVFTAALERYSAYMTNEYKLSIFQRMFERNLTVAKAAGKFLARYLRLHSDNGEEQLLKSLLKKVMVNKEFAERIPFFLESCGDFISELKNCELIVRILLDANVDFTFRKYLVEILNESVRYTLTGKFSRSRQIHSKGFSSKSEDHVEIAGVVVPDFPNLMIHFQSDKKCIKQLTELLTFIDYKVCLSQDLIVHYNTMLVFLKDLFNTSTDKGLVETITSVFSHFSEKQYFTRAHIVIEVIKNNCVQTLMDDLKQLSPTSDRSSKMRLRETSMKLSFLFAKFNLTNVLKWEDIFQHWDVNHLKVSKYLIVCCKWHLVWSLRQFIRVSSDGDGSSRVNHLLYNNCKDFAYGCVDMLRHAGDNSESFLIFESFCDLYALFEVELKRKRQFEHFAVKITEPVCVEVLFDFVLRYVVDNKKLFLEQRQKYFSKVVDVILLGALPLEYLSKVLKFYHSHYEEFGIIINNIFSQLSFSNPALPLLIMHTLAESYKQILEKYKAINPMSDEVKELKLLVRKFTSVKELKSPTDLLKLVHMCIYFAFRQKQNYHFLYFARYFANILNESGKSDAYHLFKEMVPQEDRNNDVLLLFAGALKSSK